MYLKNRDVKNPPWIICRTTYTSDEIKEVNNRLNDKCKQLNDWFYTVYGYTLKYLIIGSTKSNPFPDKKYHLCFYVDSETNCLHTAVDHHVCGGETISRLAPIVVGCENVVKLPTQNLLVSLLNAPRFLINKPHKMQSCLDHKLPSKMRIFHWELTTSVKKAQNMRYCMIF